MRMPRSGSAAVLVAGVVVLLLAGAAIGQLFLLDRARALAQTRAHQVLLTRLFEDRAARELDSAAQALATLAQLLVSPGAAPSERVSAALAQTLEAHRGLRELAVIDLQGRLLASSRGGGGRAVDIARFRPLPGDGRDVLGAWTPGRFLGDEPAPGAPGVGHLPLLRTAVVGGQTVLLVATLNADSLSLAMRLALGDGDATGALLSLDGQVLAHSGTVEAGVMRRDRAPMRAASSPAPSAAFEGEGLEGDDRLGVWRTASAWPLVVVVETPLSNVLADWGRHVRGHALVAALALLLMALSLGSAWRVLRSRERARHRRDQAQSVLLQRGQELHGLVGHLQTLLFRTDDGGRVSFLNAHWQALLGDRAAALAGQPLSSAFVDSDRPAVASLFAEPAAGRARSARVTLLDPGGQPRRHDLTVVPMLGADGLLGFAGCAVEVTGQELEQARLQAELAFHARLIELSPLPLSLLDDRGRYMQVNRAWEAFTGRSRADTLGQPAGAQLVGQEAERHALEDQRLRSEGGVACYESPYTRPDGSRRTLLVTKARLPEEGARPPLILCLVTDITALRAAEAATLRARGDADQMREVMAGLAGEVEALLAAGPTGPAAPAGSDAIERLQDLACLIRLQLAERQPLPATDLVGLMRSVLGELELRAGDAFIQLPPGPLEVTAPEAVLRRVLARVLRALRHGGHGPLVVDVRRDASGAVALSLGTGFPAAPDGDAATTPLDDGLATARRLALSFGATLLHESLGDGGVRVRLEWQRAHAAK